MDGITPRELAKMIRALTIQNNVLGIDVAEYNPMMDSRSFQTAEVVMFLLRNFIAIATFFWKDGCGSWATSPSTARSARIDEAIQLFGVHTGKSQGHRAAHGMTKHGHGALGPLF